MIAQFHKPDKQLLNTKWEKEKKKKNWIQAN